MERVYIICIFAGVIVPLITLLLGSIGELFEGISNAMDNLDFDFSIDFMGVDLCILPFSLQCFSGALLIFGAVGKLLYNGENLLFTNVAAGISGYVTAVLFQTLIHRLKKIKNTTYSKEQLLLYDANVVHSILKNGYGSVSITTLDGITTEYPAKALYPDEVIKQGTIVRVVRFEKNVAIVELKIEEKYDLKQ